MSTKKQDETALPLVLSDELHPLEEELLREKIRREKAEADIAMLELAKRNDEERDRQVKGGKVRYLFINGTIGGKFQEAWMDALNHWARRDPGEPIQIDIDSQGGSVSDGFALFDLIQRLRDRGHHVTTRAVGMAASMGAVLLQAGTDRVIAPHAKILIHEGSVVFAEGTSLSRAEQEDLKVYQDLLTADILDILSTRSKLSKAQVQRRWKRKDWWLGAEEAVKLGFADRIE